MYDIDYDYVVTENDEHDDVVLVINDYYNQSDICEICSPAGGTPVPDYVVVKDVKEDAAKDAFYDVDYAL